MTTLLQAVLAHIRELTPTVRDQGTSFEKLMIQYFSTEAFYRSFYDEVLPYADWVTRYGAQAGIERRTDTGIDLVAITKDGRFHAIQCKNYAPDYCIVMSDISNFFAASGRACFSNRIIVATTDNWSQNALDVLESQHPPVSRIGLHNLNNSAIDWSRYHEKSGYLVVKPKKQLRDHQEIALKRVVEGFKEADRGKMIMACGTGKTFTSLKIAEKMAGAGKRVLFLVPSLALLSQALTEWTQESAIPLKSFAVCSDSDVGRIGADDRIITGISELQYPATTDADSLRKQIAKLHSDEAMTVVFSTYHSIGVIHEAQQAKEHPLPAFDLIICDEAHRTTGATFDREEESSFVQVHNNACIKGNKRLYMTATPRIYGEDARKVENVTLCSMDDEALYGKELYTITFSEAVSRKLLVDYKVIVLAIEESHINRRLQDMLSDQGNSLKVDDAAKIVGCWKALSKQGLFTGNEQLAEPMKRAVAFCQVIEPNYKGNKHKVSSKLISEMFGAVVSQYQEAEKKVLLAQDPDAELDSALSMKCEAEHVDGSMNASEKGSRLEWLKADTEENTCRILSNVRCLSEGVDVPALDAVLFLTPRSSQVDVVQSVGRVMRLSPGKQQGYVILPVVIPAGVEPKEALDNNETYRVVWHVLNALRAHDDRFDAMINKLEFNGSMPSKMEVIAIADSVKPKARKQIPKQRAARKARNGTTIGSSGTTTPTQEVIGIEIGEIERALCAKIVKKCGNRHHWEDWANDIAKIANTHIDRIKAILEDEANTAEIAAFQAFAKELRDDLNNSISDDEIIEMLAQHLITKPVFDALFEQYRFAEHNPMSQAMQQVLDQLQEHHLDKERNTLEDFYASVKMRARDVNSAEGKQRIVVELYDKFFRNAFPRMTERLGIVYTPVEVVDFILHSVEHVLKTEFNSSMADENVHILDPFTGTGTFITRLLQSGIIPEEKLPYKYQHEIHANEIVLLAYYIAAINIEATYHGILTGNIHGEQDDDASVAKPVVEYQSFKGICLTDTFQMAEKEDQCDKDKLLEKNSHRRKHQQKLNIRVIVGNPPYSAGQRAANDNNANVAYPKLDDHIRSTYVARSAVVNRNALYDSYIRAIRWSSNRIGNCGVIGFVTNAGFIEANAADGLRQCLAEEFSNLYIFHLRGNARTSGERRRKEKDNIFGQGTRTPIAISILVKNSESQEQGRIYFYDIGDYLTREQKLKTIADFGSIEGITKRKGWQEIEPDQFGDWLNQRDPNFDAYMALGDRNNQSVIYRYDTYSSGIKSNRDAWVYNFSHSKLANNMTGFIDFYETQIDKKTDDVNYLKDFNARRISWDSTLNNRFIKSQKESFDVKNIKNALYRPFTKTRIYHSRFYNNTVGYIHKFFPTKDRDNLVISLTGLGTPKEFSCVITNVIPDIQLQANGQCFPLYLYEKTTQVASPFNEEGEPQYQRRDAITDDALEHFQAAYPQIKISKEAIFYYIYGLLHSADYRVRYADNLSKQLPRIPRVKTAADFKAFSQAGRDLAHLHLNYETMPMHTSVRLTGSLKYLKVTEQKVLGGEDKDFYVTKMKFGKKRDPETGKSIDDKTTVIYNTNIVIKNIPEEAYDYEVNGKPALEWVMERQCVQTDKASGITNDANDWAIETMDNARYPLELFLRVITVSLKSQVIVNGLPKLTTQAVALNQSSLLQENRFATGL